MTRRIERRFAALKDEGRAGLITFLTAGDPDMETFETILAGLPQAGADLIEIGMPFSDPMADGPAIQAAGLRSLKNGTKLSHILAAVRRFREIDAATPLVLMGYYNPIYRYGGGRFVSDLAEAGGDGLIVVDLPPEESGELLPAMRDSGLDFIRLTTPTSDDNRLPTVLRDAGGFVYHVAIAGVTGTRTAEIDVVAAAVGLVKRHTSLPVAVGFGIRTPAQAAAIARVADAAVVGTALVEIVAKHGAAAADPVQAHVAALAAGVRGARVEERQTA